MHVFAFFLKGVFFFKLMFIYLLIYLFNYLFNNYSSFCNSFWVVLQSREDVQPQKCATSTQHDLEKKWRDFLNLNEPIKYHNYGLQVTYCVRSFSVRFNISFNKNWMHVEQNLILSMHIDNQTIIILINYLLYSQ